MTDSNVHGQSPEPGRSGDLMADLAAAGQPSEGPAAPHRVIGTPSPAEARTMLAPAPEEEHPPTAIVEVPEGGTIDPGPIG